MKKHNVCNQPLINKRNTCAVSWTTSAWAATFWARVWCRLLCLCSDMTQLLLAGENLAWSLAGLHGVGLLVLFLFLPISGYFSPWGANDMYKVGGFPKTNQQVAFLDQPFLYLLLTPDLCSCWDVFLNIPIKCFSRIIVTSCFQLIPSVISTNS